MGKKHNPYKLDVHRKRNLDLAPRPDIVIGSASGMHVKIKLGQQMLKVRIDSYDKPKPRVHVQLT